MNSNTISWSGGGSVGSGLVRNGFDLFDGERRERGLDARLECCDEASNMDSGRMGSIQVKAVRF